MMEFATDDEGVMDGVGSCFSSASNEARFEVAISKIGLSGNASSPRRLIDYMKATCRGGLLSCPGEEKIWPASKDGMP